MAYIFHDPDRQMLEAAEQELRDSLQQVQFLKRRIPELKDVIRSLKSMIAQRQQTQETRDSLPQLCLRLLSMSQIPQSAQQIRDGLRVMGVEVQGANPLGIIYTALTRLAQTGFVESLTPFPGAPKHYRITTAGRLALQQV